ncbi:MAG TPA: hypothetical protein VGG32_08705 [Thermoplasmata archaeon]|jgi:hypothetical protein
MTLSLRRALFELVAAFDRCECHARFNTPHVDCDLTDAINNARLALAQNHRRKPSP